MLVEVFPFKQTSRVLYIGAVALNIDNTTNSIAEYETLRTELEAALNHGYANIYVVGDSEFIIDLMWDGRVPRAAHLIGVHNLVPLARRKDWRLLMDTSRPAAKRHG